MRYTKTLATLASLLVALPAMAATFPDVPETHWAHEAIQSLTTGHKLLQPLADGRFHGNKPFTRYQFAQTLKALIEEVEAQAKTSIAGRDTGAYQFSDVPADQPQRDTLRELANKYHLYEGVPDLDPANFRGDKTVSRYEMAVVLDNLMRQAEAKDVVRISRAPRKDLPFTDLPSRHWAKPVVESVYGRYGVMVGFPDDTFRGQEELTRYQFAAAAHQSIPLIQALVRETLEAKEQDKQAPTVAAIDETPWDATILIGVTPTVGVGVGLQATQDLGDWFVSERVRLLPTSPSGGFAGELGLIGGYDWELAPGVRLRPSLGLGGWTAFGTAPDLTLTAGYGLGLAWQPSPQWSFGADAEGRHSLVAQSGLTTVGLPILPSGRIRAAYHPVPGLALQLGAAAWGVPMGNTMAVVAGPTLGMRWRF